jgi:sterol O-acyltransferase
MTILYFLLEHYVYPSLNNMHKVSAIESLFQLLIPFLLGWLMLFYIIFECICNATAELTRFADRSFYADWWNRYIFSFRTTRYEFRK